MSIFYPLYAPSVAKRRRRGYNEAEVRAMHEIDRERFGAFVAGLRKERGLTQKELAQRIYVSDKAVSKWERGAGMPDISMLMPLAQALDVTVAELLEGRRIEPEEPVSARQAEELVQKALNLRDGARMSPQSRKHWGGIYGICLAVSLALTLMCWLRYGVYGTTYDAYVLLVALSGGFGAYFCFGVRERLPAFYDENKVNGIVDGPFRMNVPGIYFNNRNWPHILFWLRMWCLGVMVAVPLIWPLFIDRKSWAITAYVLVILSLLAAVYIPGKKYE